MLRVFIDVNGSGEYKVFCAVTCKFVIELENVFFSSIIINFKFSVMKKFFLVVLAMVMLGSVQAQTAFKTKLKV